MTALTLPRTLTDPGEGVAAAVQGRRILWPLLALMAATAFAGAAFALRWDPAPGILQKLEMSGQLKGMPEAELVEQITTAGRLKLVTGIASGVFLTPLVVLGIAVVLALVAWLLGKKAPFPALFSASAVGMLPVAFGRALWGLVALCAARSHRGAGAAPLALVARGVGPRRWTDADPAPRLARSLPAPGRRCSSGVGFAAATGMRRRSGLWVGLALFLAFVGVFGVGIPGMMSGGPATGPVARVDRGVADERAPALCRARRDAHHPGAGARRSRRNNLQALLAELDRVRASEQQAGGHRRLCSHSSGSTAARRGPGPRPATPGSETTARSSSARPVRRTTSRSAPP